MGDTASVPDGVTEDEPGGRKEYETAPPGGTVFPFIMLTVIRLLVLHPNVKLAGLEATLNVGKPSVVATVNCLHVVQPFTRFCKQ
jgi:hypothetical protein